MTGLAHIALISIGIENGSAEQLACKLAVFLVLVFGQEFLVALVGRVEALDGLQYEGIYYLFVVIPIETLLFQNGIELGIVLNEHLIELAPHFTVSLIRIVIAVHIFLIYFTLLYLITLAADKLLVVFPGELLVFQESVEHLVLLELDGELVKSKFVGWFVCAFTLRTSCENIKSTSFLS